MTTYRFFATTLKGLEDVLAEISRFPGGRETNL